MLKFGIILSILFTIPGEMLRLPIGHMQGILPNDIFLPILIIFWLIKKIAADRKFPKTEIFVPFMIFVGIAVISLLSSLRFLETSETLEGTFYLIRFIEYIFLFIITRDIAKKSSDKQKILYALILAAVAIAIAGFVQLKIHPDFTDMEDIGWDPHVGRLLSTWFDPNFVSGMLAFMFAVTLGTILYVKKRRPILFVSILIILAATVLTYSRSGYLALGTGFFVIGMLRSKKLLLAAVIAAVIFIPFSNRAQERIVNMYHSAKSLITQTAETPDITAQHRINSWNRAIEVYKKHPIVGSGYNTFKYVQAKEGLITNIDSHASTGADSSVLTILATTGPLGLIAFLAIYFGILRNAYKDFRNSREKAKGKIKKKFSRGLGLGILGGTLALLVHSIFVNSLFFPHIMVFFWIAAGLQARANPRGEPGLT